MEEHRFMYSWELVTLSFWEKYPSPYLPHVKEAIVLDRRIDPEGKLVTKRLMCVQQAVPAPLRPFSGGLDTFYAIEETIVDPVAKNPGFNFAKHVIFSCGPTTRTKYTGIASAETDYVSHIFVKTNRFPRIISTRIEANLTSTWLANTTRGIEAVEYICSHRL